MGSCERKSGAQKNVAPKSGARKRGAQKSPEPKRPRRPAKSVARNSGVTGISWDRWFGRWIVDWRHEHQGKRKYIRPKDDSPEEIESARLVAVELLRQVKGS